MSSPAKVLFDKEGVFIHTTVARADEDALVAGKMFLLEKPEGVFVEWKAKEDCEGGGGGGAAGGGGPSQGDTDWTVVDAVGYKNEKTPDSGSVIMKAPRKPSNNTKYVIDFDIHDLKCFKRSQPNLGWSYLIFILKCGTTYPALHFHQGGTKAFIKELEKYLIIKRSPNDGCLYLVREHDPQALSKSFDELQLFEEQGGDIITNFVRDPYKTTMGGFSKVTNKFVQDPYTTTMSGFSKVTNFLRGSLMVPPEHHPPDLLPPQEQVVSELLSEDLPGMAINNQEEPGYEMITTRELPPRPNIKRGSPVNAQQWVKHMDKEGRVTDVESLKKAIFRGGVEPSLRNEVWKFLLEYYSWDSTYHSRSEQRKKKVDDYFRMKLQWKSVSNVQEKRNGTHRERKNLIDKDVTRTDRTHPFFIGEGNPNITVLNDILMTYCMYNFDLGYVQGMSDLLAPILVVMENEVDSFWCFVGFMELVCHNFDMDQEGMKTQLMQLNILIRFIDPQLHNYLESHDSSNMYFCFRWLLILFKREFSFPDIMRLWEVHWTGQPCVNFHLVLCIAVLDRAKNTLMESNFGFTEILKYINDMTGSIDLEEMLSTAEALHQQLDMCPELPDQIKEILGFPIDARLANGSDASSTPRDRKSSPSTPERSLKASAVALENYRRKTNSNSTTNTGSSRSSASASSEAAAAAAAAGAKTTVGKENGMVTTATTPDDSSIEILPDQMEMVMY